MEPVEVNASASPSKNLPARIALTALIIVSLKAFAEILYHYRWYLPLNFDASPFLSGRRFTFTSEYATAFYIHLVAGPLSLLLGTFLMVSGIRGKAGRLHRVVGKTQLAVILLSVVPSGVLMAMRAYGGTVAQSGFLTLSLLTGWTGLAAAWSARAGRLESHRLWAMRCYALLWSPLLLRLFAGVMIVTGLESEATYQANAWVSWLVPLAAIQWIARHRRDPSITVSTGDAVRPQTSRSTPPSYANELS